jgi:hypothetical protein
MNTADRKLMQEILEAMEHLHRTGDTQVFDLYAAPEIIPALRERLAQPEKQPVAWVCYGAPGKRDIDFEEADINGLPIGTNLYTTPPAAQPEPVQEPVASVPIHPKTGPLWAMTTDKPDPERLPSYPLMRLYTTPPAARTWVGLTKADINEIWKGEPMLLPWDMTRTLAIEQRLKEKNT